MSADSPPSRSPSDIERRSSIGGLAEADHLSGYQPEIASRVVSDWRLSCGYLTGDGIQLPDPPP
jgi:hypothetical protein